ncbi:MAG: amino acid permease, partial [Metallosphaera sp.]
IRKRLSWFLLSLFAIAFSSYELLQSIRTSPPVIVYFFMGTIILGFLAAEVIEMSKETEDMEEDRNDRSMKRRLRSEDEKQEKAT